MSHFKVYSEHDGYSAVGPCAPWLTAERVASMAEEFPESIYFEAGTCSLVAGVGWVHVAPYTEHKPSGVVVHGCHDCGVWLVD